MVIEVSDDGGGLPYDKILAKAVAQGLVPANQSLTDEEIAALIFRPGFSTADRVSNLSGRGVGLDVVARNIQALRGTVEIPAEADKAAMEAAALADSSVQRHLAGLTVRKVVVVPGKLVNIVAN